MKKLLQLVIILLQCLVFNHFLLKYGSSLRNIIDHSPPPLFPEDVAPNAVLPDPIIPVEPIIEEPNEAEPALGIAEIEPEERPDEHLMMLLQIREENVQQLLQALEEVQRRISAEQLNLDTIDFMMRRYNRE